MVALGWHDDRKLASVLPQKEAKAIAKNLGINTVGELLDYFPRTYSAHGMDLGHDGFLGEEGDIVTVVGTVAHTAQRTTRNGQFIYQIFVDDGYRQVAATFFHARWVSKILTKGVRCILTGKVSYFQGKPQLQHPDFLVLPEPGERKKSSGALAGLANSSEDEDVLDVLRSLPYIPIYRATAGLPTWRILGAVHAALEKSPKFADPLGKFAPTDMPSFDEALREIHEPTARGYEAAQERLRYDEALEIALVMALRRADVATHKAPSLPLHDDGARAALIHNLPFSLTKGQQEVVDEISADLKADRPMSRLLQGEVGSGKTIVALIAMLQAVDEDKQCAFLAPTEVLAQQQARSIKEILAAADTDATVVVLTGSMPTKERQEALLAIMNGDADIVVGTHALIQDSVEFYDLGLVIIDEQHRFGVEQRNNLRLKGRDGITPHVLVMTATPIPRTIAMTAFGDLEISSLKELPGGRRLIQSYVVEQWKKKWLDRAYERMREEVHAGHQVYIVCPRIVGEGGVEEFYGECCTALFPDLKVAMLYGRMPAEEKESIMTSFAAGDIDILVATTVIEVGIDVPNATVMMIRESESFGVSQLHQLRGRVGRGGNESICFFHIGLGASEQAIERVTAVANTSDGFELAEIDLLHRREGDILGQKQSGVTNRTKLLNYTKDKDLIQRANRDAAYIVAKDPELARRLVSDLDDQSQEFIEKS